MCLKLSQWFNFFFTKYALPSFADELIAMNHHYDNELEKKFRAIHFEKDSILLRYNPRPTEEREFYAALNEEEKINMLNLNILLHSRLFIQDAQIDDLLHKIANKNKVRILDVNCGKGLNLLGILTYFGSVRFVEYIGIDTNANDIRQCKSIYQDLGEAQFRCKKSIADYLTDPTALKYDIILMKNSDKTLYFEMTENLRNEDGGIIFVYDEMLGKSLTQQKIKIC